MTISDLMTACDIPGAYTPGTAFMWTDPHISARLLPLHLSQETDLASRRAPAIEATLKFILDRAPDRPLDILDLGCGPGLYTESLAALGHRVTGMDISKGSIAHAQKSAREKGLAITYIHRDYLTPDKDMAPKGQYDIIMLIFTDFGVLDPDQRQGLLDRIRSSLKPGGRLVFDVLNTNWKPEDLGKKSWEINEDGFWRPGPYLALSQTVEYDSGSPDLGLFLSQHVVTDETGTQIYRFYTQTFSDKALADLMTTAGFRKISCTSGILPGSELYQSDQVTFCTAISPGRK